MRQGWKIALGIILSAISLMLILRTVNLLEAIRVLSQANPFGLLISLIPYTAILWGKLLRWYFLIAPKHPVLKHQLFSAMAIGHTANLILPAHLGELVRVYVIGRDGCISRGYAFSSIVVEKIMDVFVLLCYLLLLLPHIDVPPWILRSISFLCLSILVVLLAGLGLNLRRDFFLALFSPLIRFLPHRHKERMLKQAHSALDAFSILTSLSLCLCLLGGSFIVWMLTAIFVYIILMAFHISAPFEAAVLVMCVTNLAMAVPSAPGYIGVFHYLVLLSLEIFGVKPESALSFALALHVLSLFPLGFVGLICMWRRHYHLSKLKAATSMSET